LRTRDLVERDDGNNKGSGQLGVFGKGSKTRPVLVPAGIFGELIHLALLDPDAPIFRSQKKGSDGGARPITALQAERIVKKAAKKAGLSKYVSPLWLRHSHATHAKRRGADLDLIMRTLRHASLSTTGRYTCTPTPPTRRRCTWGSDRLRNLYRRRIT